MKKCKHCGRDKPDFTVDPTCAKGGYCEWADEAQAHASWALPGTVKVTQLGGSKVSPMDVPWADGAGIVGRRMMWNFPNTAIVEGLEVQPHGSSYHGFIDAVRIGLCEYLHVGPFPILMWSPGMPEVSLWLPSVPYGHQFTLETRDFYGKIRPRGLVINP